MTRGQERRPAAHSPPDTLTQACLTSFMRPLEASCRAAGKLKAKTGHKRAGNLLHSHCFGQPFPGPKPAQFTMPALPLGTKSKTMSNIPVLFFLGGGRGLGGAVAGGTPCLTRRQVEPAHGDRHGGPRRQAPGREPDTPQTGPGRPRAASS